jgi:hypothetical protein
LEKALKPKKKKPLLPIWSGAHAESSRKTHSAEFALFMNIAVRLALLCMATAGVVLMFIQMYNVPVDVRTVVGRTVSASLFFNLLFIYVKFRYVLPFLGFFVLFYVRFSETLYNLGRLGDYLLIYIDGGLLHTAGYASRGAHDVIYRMTSSFQAGLQSALIFCAVMLALLFAITARGKFIGSILITAIILVIPAIASQKASYVPAVTLLVCAMFGLYSIWASQEQSFLKNMNLSRRKKKKPPFIPQIHRHSVNGAAAACLALVAVMIAQLILPAERAHESIEFWGRASDRVLDRLYDIGDLIGGGFTGLRHINIPPLDTSGYMPGGGINASGSLTISNPTISRRPVLNVTLDNNHSPVYLRNGIGSSYDAARERWNVEGGRSNHMRDFPAHFYPEHEYFVFRQIAGNLGFLADSLIGRQRIDIEYLVRTPHVMLPTSPYLPGFKQDSRFNWRGDVILEKRGSNNPQTYTWDVLYPRHTLHLANAIESVQNAIFTKRPLTGEEASMYAISGRFEDYVFLSFEPVVDYTGTNGLTEGALRISVVDYGLTAAEYLYWLGEYETLIYDIYTETSPAETENIREFLNVFYLNIPSFMRIGNARTDAGVISYTIAGGDTFTVAGSRLFSDYEYAMLIEDFFKSNFEYSLTVDNHSGDNTLLGNFLFETQSGHCALYATAMTLMLRELGIPARYVTGYVAGGGRAMPVISGSFYSSERYLHTILERDLHAWVEVYFKGIGWLPFDPTPAISEAHFAEAERGTPLFTTPVTTTTPVITTLPPPVTTPPTVTTPPVTTTLPQNGGTVGTLPPPEIYKPVNTVLMLTILLIIVIIALACSIAVAVKMFLKGVTRAEQRRLARYANLTEPAAAREAYRFMLRLLGMEGITAAAGETPRKFARRVDEDFCAGSLNPVISEILKLEFSREELTAEEYGRLSEAVQSLYGRAVTEQKRIKRLLRRIVVLDVIK